jgi:hypothetical protein
MLRKIMVVAALMAAGLGLGLPANADPASEFLGGPASVAQDGVPVYYLAADFVASGQAPVANLQYTAKTAKGPDGRVATVWMANGELANIASGDDESRYAAAAGPGATVFREPQINAWYALRGDKVLPLNDSARNTVGLGLSVPQYQKVVHARYADKMPGSEYAKSGAAGGYATAAEPSSPGWPIGGGLLAVVLVVGFFMTRRPSR